MIKVPKRLIDEIRQATPDLPFNTMRIVGYKKIRYTPQEVATTGEVGPTMNLALRYMRLAFNKLMLQQVNPRNIANIALTSVWGVLDDDGPYVEWIPGMDILYWRMGLIDIPGKAMKATQTAVAKLVVAATIHEGAMSVKVNTSKVNLWAATAGAVYATAKLYRERRME